MIQIQFTNAAIANGRELKSSFTLNYFSTFLYYFCMHRAGESTAGFKRIYAESARRMTRAHEIIALTFLPDASVSVYVLAYDCTGDMQINRAIFSDCLLRRRFYG
jgi:hypothetical protein